MFVIVDFLLAFRMKKTRQFLTASCTDPLHVAKYRYFCDHSIFVLYQYI